MASLIPIPSGAPIPLDPSRPACIESPLGDRVVCVLAAERGRWVLFDVSGESRVNAAAVAAGATTLEPGALIRAGTRRLRFEAPRGPASESESDSVRCGFCRDAVAAESSRCRECGRGHHRECLAFAKRCGRCGVAQ